MPRSLDLVVTSVATQLMEATAATAPLVSQKASVAAAPLVPGETTTGLLGFVKFGARKPRFCMEIGVGSV